MDLKQIQELIKLVSETGVGEVSLEQKDFKLTIRAREEQITQIMASGSMPQQTAFPAYAPQHNQPALGAPGPAAAAAPPAEPAAPVATAIKTITIKSPMIGTFYRRPSPDKPLLVDVGQTVEPGKVVCMIEAMKLFNEIESEVTGKIVKVLVEDASPVEYDQPLFEVEPA